MIKVLDLITLLKASSLKNLPIKDSNSVIVMFINQALAELYRKFNLSVKSTVVIISKYKHIYTLNEPDVNMILSIYDTKGNIIKSSNNIESTEVSYKLVNYNSFTLNNCEDDQVVCIYSAGSDIVGIDDEIAIPPGLQGALLMYVGYLANMSINIDDTREADAYRQRYEYLAQVLLAEGYKVELFTESSIVKDGGYV